MTCREKLKLEHPDKIDKSCMGGCYGCPHHYDYLPKPANCGASNPEEFPYCAKCWDREIPGTEKVTKETNPTSSMEFIHSTINECLINKDGHVSIYFATDGSVTVSVYPNDTEESEV